MKIKSFFPFSLLLIILSVFTSCSSDDDFGEAIPKEQVINYFPLSTGNEWEYLNKEKIADESLSEEIEWLRVSDSIEKYETPGFIFSSNLTPKKQGVSSRFLTHGILNKVDAKLVFNGEYNISLPLLGDSLNIPLENALILHQNKPEKYVLHETEGVILSSLNIETTEIPIRYAYHLKIIQGEDYKEMRNFEQITSSELVLTLSGTTILPSGETLEILPDREVLNTTFYFAKDTGIFLNESNFYLQFKNLSTLSLPEIPIIKGWKSQELKSIRLK